MSGVGGVLYFEARECERTVLDVLERRLTHLGPDDGGILCAGSIGFVHRAFHTTAEARLEQQPYQHDGVIVCVDGRLDNRTDLAAALHLVEPRTPDVALIAAAYGRWGHDSIRRLHGDFALVIWDARQRTLALARDGFGIRPLCYHLNHQRILWASTADALLDLPGVSDEIDEEYLGGYFTLGPEVAHSPFKWIKPVIPGRVMLVRDGAVTNFTHWDPRELPAAPPDAPGQPGPANAEAVEQFRELLTDAVRVRLRADRPVVAELSGGLDSSTIICIADRIARESGGRVPEVHTLSRLYDRGRKGEDGYFCRLMEQHRCHPGLHVSEQDEPVLGQWPDPEFLAFPRRFLCSGAARRRGEVIHAAGARVVLSGYLGDELLGQQPGPRNAYRFVRRGRWLQAFRLCREFSLQRQRPALMLFHVYGIRPNLPLALRGGRRYPIPRWLNPDFATRLDLRERVKQRALGSLPVHLAISLFRAPDLVQTLDMLGTEGTSAPTRAFCVELRYPYAHRPLVEFLLSRPGIEIHGGQHRWLQRAALDGMLPEEIRTRTTKGSVDESIARAIDREWDRLVAIVQHSEACARGYLSKEPLLDALRRYRHGLVIGFGDVLRAIALEMWLKGLATRPRADLRYVPTPGRHTRELEGHAYSH